MKRLAMAFLLCAACADDAQETVLRLRLSMSPGAPAPDKLSLSIYDPYRAILIDTPVMPPGGVLELPGDLVVLVRADAGALRVSVSAWTQTLVARGTALARPAPQKETVVDVLLAAPPGADTDGDGVPDAIDDCPSLANPDQADRDGNGLGDVCQMAHPDGGAPACGDGHVDPGEDCDDGPGNSDAPAAPATCSTGCKRRAPCGDVSGAAAAGVDPDTGHCYVAWDALQPWQLGWSDCQSRGGMLAVITSPQEEALAEQLAGGVARWIGLWRAAPGNDMTWTDGEALGYTNFAPLEPDDPNQTCGDLAPDGWHDSLCGFPPSGILVSTPGTPKAYLCEHTCGNGQVDPGEQCDPPGPDCTVACQRTAACPETNGQLAALTGNCFFPSGTPAAYDPIATAAQCPAGTHLAAPQTPDETTAAYGASVGNAAALWIGLRAPATAGVFAWDVPGFAFVPDRYHGFVGADPNLTVPPACVAVDPASAAGWHDRTCTNAYAALCERER